MLYIVCMGKQLCAFRLHQTLIERVDRYANRLELYTPGMTFNRSDAVRVLLTLALDQVEGKDSQVKQS